MSWLATNLVAAFFLPPLCFLLLLGLSIACLNRHPKTARLILIVLAGLLYLGTTPYFTEAALHTLESGSDALRAPYGNADAIVILGGGSYFRAPEYAADTVSEYTLARVRYGAKLQRATGTPVLVTGGKPVGSLTGEATQMRAVLEQEFQVPVRWIEDDSDNTAENARNSFRMLHPLGIQTIYLVTHAWHMPRAARAFRQAGFTVIAARAFRQAGFTVIAAPTAFTTRDHLDILAFVPRAESLRDAKIFFHELLGMLWYRIKS